eukprot:TRINITY_DN3210_c0_g2_i1.p1 TRINITY_DN3210_c0_g2~~TRINITY_DN3210_c0_g2_i1.p1  ORF type:complete len:952 (-),score=368.79 TRINITY_DN3210_c0_g2_i1:478-3333(-)
MGQLRETIGKRIGAFDQRLEEVLTSSPVVFPNMKDLDSVNQQQSRKQTYGYRSDPQVVQPFSSVGDSVLLDNGERVNLKRNSQQQSQQEDSPSFLKDYFNSSLQQNGTRQQSQNSSSSGKQVLQLFLDGKLSPRKASLHEYEMFGNSPPRQKQSSVESPKQYRSMEERFEGESSVGRQQGNQQQSRIPKPSGRSVGIRSSEVAQGPSRIRKPTNYGAKQRLNMEEATELDIDRSGSYGMNPKMGTSLEYQRKKQQEAYQWQLMQRQQELEEQQEMEALAARQRQELARRRGGPGLSIDTDRLQQEQGHSHSQTSQPIYQEDSTGQQEDDYEEDFDDSMNTEVAGNSQQDQRQERQENISLSSVRTKATITDEDRRLERELMEEQQAIYNPQGGMVRQGRGMEQEGEGELGNTGGSNKSLNNSGKMPSGVVSKYHSFEGDQLVDLFGPDIGAMIYSRKWKDRVDGLNEIESVLRGFSRTAKKEEVEKKEGKQEASKEKGQSVALKQLPEHIGVDDALKITSYAVKVGMNDKNIHVFLASLRLLQYAVGTFASSSSHGVINSLFADDLEIILEKGSDTNARIREQTKDTLVNLAKRPNVGVAFIAHLVLRHAKKRSTSFRAVISRVVVLRELVDQFGCDGDTWLDLKHLMPYILWALNHPNGDARSETLNAILTIYSHVHEDLLPYLENVKPVVKRKLMDDFAIIDGKIPPSVAEKMEREREVAEKKAKQEEMQRLKTQIAQMKQISSAMEARAALEEISGTSPRSGEEKKEKVEEGKGIEKKAVEKSEKSVEKKAVEKKAVEKKAVDMETLVKEQAERKKAVSQITGNVEALKIQLDDMEKSTKSKIVKKPSKPKESAEKTKEVSPKASKAIEKTSIPSPKVSVEKKTNSSGGSASSPSVNVERRKKTTVSVRTGGTTTSSTTKTTTTATKKSTPAFMRSTASSQAKSPAKK